MNAAIVDHINRNNFLKIGIKTRILKSDISHQFPVFLISKTTRTNKHSADTFIKRRVNIKSINSEDLQEFKQNVVTS